MRVALCLVFLFALAPAVSHAGVEGKYSIDKKRMLQEMKATVAKLPERRRAFARMAMAMLGSMKMDLTLKKRGQASVYMFMKVFGKNKSKRGAGTWREIKNKQGAAVIRIQTKSTDTKGKVQTDTLRCKSSAGGLACVNVKGKKRKTFYFTKSKK